MPLFLYEDDDLPTWEDATAEVASNRAYHEPRKPSTETTTIVSDAKGMATVSLWHRRPGTYHVTASVTNPNSIKVESTPATVRWGHEEEDSYGYGFESDMPFYEGDTEGPYYKRRSDDHTSDTYRSDEYRSDKYRPDRYRSDEYRSDEYRTHHIYKQPVIQATRSVGIVFP